MRVRKQFIQGMELVGFFVKDVFDAGIHEDLEAVNAGGVRDVNGGVFDTGAVLCGLGDGVHLRVNRPEAILLNVSIRRLRLVDKAADIRAVRHPRGRAIIAGGEDIPVAHYDGSDFGPHTS